MSRFRAIFTTDEAEYQAALNGLNIFFGALLGVILAGTENLDTLPYITLLVMISGVIIGILYIPASAHRVVYALALMVILTAALLTVDPIDGLFGRIPLPSKILETLIVWTAATSLVQFAPRRPNIDKS